MSKLPPFPAPGRLYVHVPFCSRKCAYCAFFSQPVGGLGDAAVRATLDDFAKTLSRELELRRPLLAPGPLDSVFFGGGTPSLLGPARVEAFLGRLARAGHLGPGTEVTLEANPESLGRALDWKQAGVTRLSLGIQSLADPILAWLGRPHDGRRALEALEEALASGLSVNADLIIALPGLARNVPQEINETAALGPGHVALYVLGLEEGTPLQRRLAGQPGLDSDAQALALEEARDALLGHGFQQYEVSNFARNEGQRCRHNQGYWRHEPYLGLGPAAHSFIGVAHAARPNKRQTLIRVAHAAQRSKRQGVGVSGSAPVLRAWNPPDLAAWEASLSADPLAFAGQEALTARDLALETLMLGLRTSEGVGLGRLAQLGFRLPALDSAPLAPLLTQGLLRLEGQRLVPSAPGMLQADGLAVTLSELLVAAAEGLG